MCCLGSHGNQHHNHGAETYPYESGNWCRCAGYQKGVLADDVDLTVDGECCGATSGDDGLCDRCRNTCGVTTDDLSGRLRTRLMVLDGDGHGTPLIKLDYIDDSVPIGA